MKNNVEQYFRHLGSLLRNILVTDKNGKALSFNIGIEFCVNKIEKAGYDGKNLFFIGNGASASIASHAATDFWKNVGIRASAFNDSSLLTCISNDFGYKYVFEKPLCMFADSDDILFSISSSGKSENIILATKTARRNNLKIITLSGFKKNNPLRKLGDINFYVPYSDYGFVEVIHTAICHCFVDMTKISFKKKVKENG